MKPNDHAKFFQEALRQAKKAYDNNEVPIGAVLVQKGRILARAHNQTEKRRTFMAHSEMLCIEKACKKLKSKYLSDCSLYVVLEPCLMCQYAARLCRIDSIHYLVSSHKFGSKGSAYRECKLSHSETDDLTREAIFLLQNFFKKRR